MKLLVILSRVPYPLDKGDKLRAYHQLRLLHARHEIVLCCLTETPVDARSREALRSISTEYHIIPLAKWRIWVNISLGIFSRKPFQVTYFYQLGAHRIIRRIIAESDPDHIYCQLVRTAEYAKNEHNYPKTIDYQDAFSKGMERRQNKAKWPLTELYATEKNRLIRYENLVFEFFEFHTIISEEDRKYIYHPERREIAVVSNGIDTDYFQKGAQTARKYDLLFTGNMQYPPNMEAAEYIVEKILPVLRKSNPRISLLLAGAEPHKRVRALGATPGVHISGWLDDIRDAYRDARIFIAPMQTGTGLQNKLLEAMAMELPCITSALANTSLKAQEGVEIEIGQTPEDYAAKIESILASEAAGAKMASKGRLFVLTHFSWQQSVAILETMLTAQK